MADNNEQNDAAQSAASTEANVGVAAPFVDDIVIWDSRLDAPRKLTMAQLETLPRLDSQFMPTINSLIKQGVTIAAIPTTSGIGAACYLVNLASLKRPDDNDGH
jgi:hypothetical protein